MIKPKGVNGSATTLVPSARVAVAAGGGIDVLNGTEGWLAAELNIECAVFNIVEDAEAASEDQLTVAERVVGKGKAGREVVAVGID